MVFLYEYVSEESVEATEISRDVWFANQVSIPCLFKVAAVIAHKR